MSRFLWWILAVPAGIALVAIAVANRTPVTVALDPFRPDAPALAFEVPLYLLVFAVLAVGVLLGGSAAWFGQSRHRRAERRWRDEAERLRADRERAAEAERLARRGQQSSLSGPRKAA